MAIEPKTDPRAEVDTTAEVVAESLATSGSRPGGLLRSGMFVGFAVIASNGLNAVFQFAMARVLEPAEYSLLATMFAIVLMVTVPLSGIQAGVAREVALRREGAGDMEAGAVVRKALRSMAKGSAYLFVGGALIAYPLFELLNVDRPLPFIATAVALAVTLPLPIAYGGLQGSERFGTLAVMQPVYAGLKLLVGVSLGLAGLGASAVVFGVATATALSLLVALYPLRKTMRLAREHGEDPAFQLLGGYAVGAAIGVCGYAVHTNIDLLVARVSFTPEVAGLWAAASAGAKTVLLIPVAVTTVLFPRVSVLSDRGRERGHLVAGIVVVFAIGCVAAGIMTAFPEQLIDVAFGEKYEGAADWLGPLAFAMVLYAVVQVYLFHFLSLGTTGYAITVAAFLLVQFALFGVLHSSPEDLIIVQAIAAGMLVVVGEIAERLSRREKAT